MVRTRFAPSPTGYVHIGSLRTALFSFLYARHNKGTHVLRVEDTDQNRFVEGAMENMVKILNQMGIEFDEGLYYEGHELKQRGAFGPYVQSERKHAGIYQKYADQLLAEKKAYYCFCSESRLEEMRKEQIALKKPAMYDRHCRFLKEEEVKTNLEEFKTAAKNPVVRFAIPLEGETVINDLIYGNIKYENKVLDDQVIIKSDGFPTYHLAVVVDDHLMQITHVIRGEEWLPSTPKHILIYNALGWKPTEFAHLPLILNTDKSKLSKRQGDVSVEDFLNKGYLKEALINFVAFLGWNPKTDQEIFSLNDLIKEFDIEKINKSGAVFDLNKLDWINGQYIKQITQEKLAEILSPYWEQTIGAEVIGKQKKEYLAAIAFLEKDRLKKLSEIGERTTYFFATPEYDGKLLVWKKSDQEKTKIILDELIIFLEGLSDESFNQANFENQTKDFILKKGYDNGSVLWPLRVALTGLEKSPSPFEVASILIVGPGKNEIINRLKTAKNKI